MTAETAPAEAAGPGAGNRVLIPTHGRHPTRPPSDQVWDFAGETMGTTWSVRLVPPPAAERAVLAAAIQAELDIIVNLFSHWDPRAECARFNAAPEGFWAVSPPFWDFLNACMDLADDTNGAVDPTLGALVDLWGFGPPGPRPPDAFGTGCTTPFGDEVEEARKLSGWGKLRLNRDHRAVQQLGGLKLDFSALAKGHAVDKVCERLTQEGAIAHLVEVGGELRGQGIKPDGRPWWAELQGPPDFSGPRTLAALFDQAVATSGDYVRGFDAYGRRYGHTLDGRTGEPVNNGVVSVTVLADTAFLADGWATALTVMGAEEAMEFAEAMKIACAIVRRDDEAAEGGGGVLIETTSTAWNAMADDAA